MKVRHIDIALMLWVFQTCDPPNMNLIISAEKNGQKVECQRMSKFECQRVRVGVGAG